MYATDFEYNNEKLSDYGMMICSFSGAGDTQTVSSGADITFHQAKADGSSHFQFYASTYDTAFTTTIQICKDPDHAKTQSETYLSPDEVSALQRWLCPKDGYHKFKTNQEEFETLYWNALFSSKQILIDGRTAGLELTMFTDAPYAYLDALPLEYECTPHPAEGESSPVFTIYDASDEIGYIQPDMEITILEEGDFSLSNSMESGQRRMLLKNCHPNEVIHIDGRHQIITSSLSTEEHNIAKDFNYFFPRIMNTYENNKNDFTVSLNCRISVSYSPVRKTGL